MRRTAVLIAASLLAGCGTTIYSLRVPLDTGSTAAVADPRNVVIEDLRPAEDLKVRTGGGLARCERHYGDDTYQPAKPAYLQQLIAQRVAQDKNAHVRLQRFDTIEYCDNTANKAAAAAVAGATGATGHSVYVPTRNVPGGDSVLIRLQGEINGMPFEASRSFDYSNLSYRFNEMPAANPQYRAQFQQAMNEIADEIVAKLVAAQ